MPMNCSSGIRCPLLLTERRFTGVVAKKLLICEIVCRVAVLSRLVSAREDAPVVHTELARLRLGR